MQWFWCGNTEIDLCVGVELAIKGKEIVAVLAAMSKKIFLIPNLDSYLNLLITIKMSRSLN